MSTCSYCFTDVVWVPTTEGARPFVTLAALPSDAPVALLKRHECEERQQALKSAAKEYAMAIASDPVFRALSLQEDCPACMQPAGSPCLDRRVKVSRETKHPHLDRIMLAAKNA